MPGASAETGVIMPPRFDAGSGHLDPRDPQTDAGVIARTPPPEPPLPDNWGGGFVDLTDSLTQSAEALYLQSPQPAGEDPEAINGVITDIDEDGRPELLFATTLDHPSGRRTAIFDVLPGGAGLRLRAHFRTRTQVDRLSVAGVVDLDADGHPDVLLNRAHGELVWGEGGGRFADPQALLGPGQEGRWSPAHRAMHVTDVDQDGWLDVLTGTGQCCSTCRALDVYLQTAPRRFERRSDLLAMETGATAYAIADGTLAGQRSILLVGQNCGNTDVPVFLREAGRDAQGHPRFEGYDPTPRTSFIRTSDPSWPGIAENSIQHWVPMGIALGDADGDLRDDVAISLNFFAGLWLDRGSLPLRDMTEQFGVMPHLAASGRRMIPWGIALVDLDRDGRNDLVVTHGNDHQAAVSPADRVGPQRTIIEWNGGGGLFADATRALGVGREGQYHSLYVDDLDLDGDADLAVGSLGEHPRIFLNRIDRGHHGFSLRLRGTSSNRLGVGARVRVELGTGAPPQEFVVGAMGSPGVVVDPVVFVGLGDAERATRVRVTWPSGVVQERTELPAGTQHVWEEPSLFKLSPASRHVAPGASITVRVTPRAVDGSLQANASVSLRTLGGAVVPLRVTRDGGHEAVIPHPGRAGSSVLEITVNGSPSGVRPRVWWD